MNTKNILLTCIQVFFVLSQVAGQSNNELLVRNFWKQQPSIELIKSKIKEGHSPSEMNRFKFDATVYAILENNSLETVKFLLAQGNTVDKITHDGRNYLMWAAYKGNLELMKYLIEEGSDISIIDQHGYSLFMFPASTGQSNIAMYQYLINELGVDIGNEKDRSGRNALLAYATRLSDFDVIDFFISEGLDIHSVDEDGNGIFHFAVQTGNREVVAKLVSDYHVSTDKNTQTNENGILFATRRSSRSGETDLSFYQFLMDEYNLDPAIISIDGNTALQNLATRTRNVDIFEYFLEKGVDVNQTDDKGNNALMYASSANHSEIIELLISKTNDINAKNKLGYSALTLAVRSNTPETVELIINKGADAGVIDKKGNNLAYHAVDSYDGNPEVFNQKMKYLLESGVDVKRKQENGNSLVHAAVNKDDLDVLRSVLSYGLDINAVNDHGETALHQAALQTRDVAILQYMVDAGARRELTTEFDETAFDLAKNNELLIGKNIDFLKIEAE
jgi:ankyrin repeat protein